MNKDREQLLRKLQCPFTWNELSSCDTDKIKWSLEQNDNFVPELTFTRFLMTVYVQVLKSEFNKAQEKLAEAELMVAEFQSSNKQEVAQHIVEATKAYLLVKNEKLEEADEILKKIKNIDDEIYASSLNEFKASLWTHCTYSIPNADIAIKFAKLAIEKDSTSATSHFLLAKNLRTKRRSVCGRIKPHNDEFSNISKAYKLEKNLEFRLFICQLLKENCEFKEALKIFNEIYDMNVQVLHVQYRLALIFIHTDGYLDKAKNCLDFIEAHAPEDSRFFHYKGVYLMKKREYEKAAECLKKASEIEPNYGTDKTYFQCMRESKKNIDLTDFLIRMLEKYKESDGPFKKDIYLNIAFSYFYQEKIQECINFFKLGFEIEDEFFPKKYRCLYTGKIMNVNYFVKSKLLPKLQRERNTFSETIIREITDLEKIFERSEEQRLQRSKTTHQ